MALPASVLNKIETLIKDHGAKHDKAAWQSLNVLYRNDRAEKSHLPAFTDDLKALAYAAVRMPATHGVIQKVLSLIPQEKPIQSILDLGCGTGAGAVAAFECFPDLRFLNMVDHSPSMVNLARMLLEEINQSVNIKYENNSMLSIIHGDNSGDLPCDLVLLSYALNEMPKDKQLDIMENVWGQTSQFLVVIEPGTPHGFTSILNVRDHLIAKGAHILAPCSHRNPCPLKGLQDWCHFSHRLQRPSFHQQIKDGILGYEDEKYSFIIFAKNPPSPFGDPIIKMPRGGSGHIMFDLCTPNGVKEVTISKKDKIKYKWARGKSWGDYWSNDDNHH